MTLNARSGARVRAMNLQPWLISSALPSKFFRRFPLFNLMMLCGRFPALRWLGVATLCIGGMMAPAQTAHFSGAQATVGAEGTNVLAIAVDAKGDVFFTTQNPFVELGSRGARGAQYTPAALRSQGSRRFSDGPNSATARKMDASSCTYQGSGSGLWVLLANSGTIHNLSGLNAPYGLALDSAGDLFVLDAYSGAIYKYLAANGTVVLTGAPSFVALAQGDNCVGGNMAMDSQGDLYYTSPASNEVEEIVAVNGVIPQSPSSESLGSGYDLPAGIAVDRSGDVYVSSAESNAVEELVAVNASIPSTPTKRTQGSGFNLPAGIAVDSSGDVYVSDFNNNELKEILAVNGSIPSSPTIEILGSFSETGAVALDGSGDVFAGESGNNGGAVIELTASANFGQVNVGTAAAIGVSFTFDTGGSLGGISVLTQGVAGLDYTNTGSGTCNTKTAYLAGQSCTVNVSFTPKFSGARDGAVVLTATNGNVIATGYVQGIGVGPQVNFLPGTQSTVVATGLHNPTGVAVDGGGNVYLSDPGHSRVLKETLSAGAYTQSTVTSDLYAAYGVAIDGSGAVYVADSGNNRVLKETPTAGGYSESTIASGVAFPTAVVVDGSGNVYITDNSVGVIKETLIAGNYTQSTIITSANPDGLAVDGSGNLYLADTASNEVLKETLSGGTYTQSTLPSNCQFGPTGVAVDGGGNVYFDCVGNVQFTMLKETPSAGGYTTSTVVSGLTSVGGPFGVAVDSGGNLYFSDQGNNWVLKEDFADPPTLTFANTAAGTTSADSPQVVTVENDGNSALTFPIPASGDNPSIGPDFTLDDSGQPDCLLLNSESAGAATLAPGATCELQVSFAPTVAGSLAEPLVLTDSNLNATAPLYATQSIGLMNGPTTGTSFTLVSSPASLNVNAGGAGTADITVIGENGFAGNVSLSASGLPSGVTASFSPNPTTGTSVLTLSASSTAPLASNQPVTIVGTSGSLTASLTLYLTVIPAPEISVSASPATLYIAEGSTASATITTSALNGFNSAISLSTCAGTSIGVSVTFTPSTIPAPGNGTSTMTVTVGPNAALGWDSLCLQAGGTGYGISPNVPLYVQLSPAITWPSPGAIAYGTPLSATQLDATAGVPGTFSYSPAAGTVLTAGTQTITATFMPTETSLFTTATATVTLTVTQATPTITWGGPAAITYGTALSAAQLDASTTVAGTFSYSPAAGTVAGAGTQTLTATFTPTDTTDYTTATASVTLTVNKATPTVSWTAPAAIVYGTPLGATQLSASTTVAGSFSYSPAAGTVLGAGTQTLTAAFTPTDSTDYATATASVTLTVNQATPTITWSAPAAITYGTALSAAQLDASATVAGTFSYSPAAGTVLGAGTQTLTVTFTPTDTTDYATATASVALTVNKATPTVSWAAPAGITYGRALNASQLNASASVPGGFAYLPAAGSVLTAGTHPLAANFTPTDTTDYMTGSASVMLTVTQATPVITWATPAPIMYGTALGAAQLDATANTSGTFVYSPAAGTVLPIGTSTLKASFTPTDATDYTAAAASVALTVTQATPLIAWATPAPVNYGTKLSAAQLDATANVAGTFKYSPASGTEPSAGQQTLNVTFTPTDKTHYATATATVILTVNQVTPVITWATPAAITYGTALSSKQLDAKASVAGTFAYSPAAGTVPALGTDELSVIFTPTNSTDYATVTATVELAVNPAPGFALTASPGSVTVTTGSSSTSTITVAPTNGFAGSVRLTTQGLPSGVTASYSTNPTTSTSVLTLKAGKTATIGGATVTVTGTSGSLVETATIQLNVVK